MNQPCQFLDFFDGHDIWYQSLFSFLIKNKYGILGVGLLVCHCLWSKFTWQKSSAGTSLVRRESFSLSFAFSLWTKMSATKEGTQSESFEGGKKSFDKAQVFWIRVRNQRRDSIKFFWRINQSFGLLKINNDLAEVFLNTEEGLHQGLLNNFKWY